jgi:hypothetical protein
MNARFQNPPPEIAMEAVDIRELFPDMIIWTLLFRGRKGLGLLVGRFRKIRVADEPVMQTGGEGSAEGAFAGYNHSGRAAARQNIITAEN